MELRYEYNHYVYLEKTNEQADQEIIGYTKTYWKVEYNLLRSITGFGVLLPLLCHRFCPSDRTIPIKPETPEVRGSHPPLQRIW